MSETKNRRDFYAIIQSAGIYDLVFGMMVLVSITIAKPVNAIHFLPFGSLMMISWGLVSIAIGVVLMYSAKKPHTNWQLILIGLIYRIAVLGILLTGLVIGTWPIGMVWLIIISCIIWLPLFAIINYSNYSAYILEDRLLEDEAMMEYDFDRVSTYSGKQLKDLADDKPVILIFLRHFGCQFCKHTLHQLQGLQSDIKYSGKDLILVHMSEAKTAETILKDFGLEGVEHICDTDRTLYRYFGLGRGFLHQLFGWNDLYGSLKIFRKFGYRLQLGYGDVFQMPGIFVYHKGRIKQKFVYSHISDKPDFESLITFGGVHPVV